jgi:hypothetical protein
VNSNVRDFSGYSTIVFIDTMVVLEGKSLPSQAWADLDQVGPVLVLIAPQVMKEIDNKKRDGRVGRRAREFNKLIGPTALSGAPIPLGTKNPEVFLALASCRKIDWSKLDDLDSGEPDAKVVAQILNAEELGGRTPLFVSQDVFPIAMATRHGLAAHKLPESWLREPEQGPAEKEISRLKARVSELEVTEPGLEGKITFGHKEPVTIYRVKALDPAEQRQLVARLISENPRPNQRSPGFGAIDPLGSYDYTLDDRYEQFRSKALPNYAASLPDIVETFFNQIPFRFTLENSGKMQAEYLVLVLQAIGGTINDRFVAPLVFGPAAPTPRPRDPFAKIRTLQDHLQEIAPVPRDEMEFVKGPNRGPLVEVHCVDFRHGRTWAFDGVAHIDAAANSPFKIVATLTATNMRGEKRAVGELSFTALDAEVGQLVDLKKREWATKFPMVKEYDDALEREDTDWFDFRDGSGGDD